MTPKIRFPDELALLFTGSPAPATSRETSAVQIIEEADDPDPTSPALYTPEEQSGASTPTLADVEVSSTPSATSEHTAQAAPGAIHPILTASVMPKEGMHPLFSIEQLGVDRRLIVNRKRQLKMYRVWMQGKFRKL